MQRVIDDNLERKLMMLEMKMDKSCHTYEEQLKSKANQARDANKKCEEKVKMY